ncbi:MAG: HNH endonuclease [Pseudobdellovibrionaceae bacterium]
MEMQTIKKFSDAQLLSSLENFFESERQTTHIILLHLKEIESRKLYADRGYPDMFKMLIIHFHQSETAANQRLQALRLIKAVPVVEEKLKAGEVNLSTLALAQRQITREEKVTGKKVEDSVKAEIIEKISSKTIAQAEVELMTLLPESSKTIEAYERRISKDETRVGLTFPDRVMEKLERFKNYIAAANPKMDSVEVIERALDIALEKVDPTRKQRQGSQASKTDTSLPEKMIGLQNEPASEVCASSSRKLTSEHRARKSEVGASVSKSESKLKVGAVSQRTTDSVKQSIKRKTYYSVRTDCSLWTRANSHCEYVNPVTKTRCSSCFGLERDHVIPLALGGSNDISNLRLLCRTHNLMYARKYFGPRKIQREINRSRNYK